ncbi:fungal protease inhibitor F-like [Bombyx mandarina]|uniref:Fungal protease inhibitor F-like n=1 Tax=Bombyx mandarina TaxID=7092 RepID=A0A6J2JLM9_BOMMA|nr:fungal protease inhibitor F-like [Bombyx mandarina]
MAAKQYFIVFLIVALMALEASTTEYGCPENAHWTDDPCVRTCDDPYLTNTACVGALIQTCHCNDGLVFNADRKCVPISDC